MNRSGGNSHRRDKFVILTNPKRMVHAILWGPHGGSTRLGQEAEGARGKCGQESLFWFP